MKGLTQFIVDVRNSNDAEEEKKRIKIEINNIQTKFSTSNLNSYQRRKYICKLIYITLLGYDELIEFGIKESISMIGSKTLYEKSLGYLSLAIIFNNNLNDLDYFTRLFNLVYTQLASDLRIDNEEINNLALHFIANSFNLPNFKLDSLNEPLIENFTELVNQVYSFAISPMSTTVSKKKSLICLKCLFSIYPEIIVINNNWIPRLVSLIDFNNDISIILNSIPLIEKIITISPKFITNLLPSVVNDLFELVISKKCDDIFQYHGIPAPWLVIKLFQLLESCFLLGDSDLLMNMNPKDISNLKMVISTSINHSVKHNNVASNKNIQSAILFQSVSIAVFLNASQEAISGAINALLNLLKSPDTNTRYLSLDVLIKLIGRSTSDDKYSSSYNGLIFKNIHIIEALLNDKDISIKRKSLDLLYIITNDSNYQIITNKLIEFFPVLEYQLKSELSIKIAILAEKFAKDSTWYVNTMIRLLSVPQSASANSEFLNKEIWERIIQIVINNEDLHTKTCRLLMNKLIKSEEQGSIINENLIKISCFLIGEYGYLIQKDFPPFVQFQLFFNLYMKSNLNSRSMILSTFFKFLDYYPNEEFIPNILDLFEVEKSSVDLEIQSRANEYLNLFTLDSKLLNIIKPLPPFETKRNHLLARIGTIEKIVGVDRVRSLEKKKTEKLVDLEEESEPNTTSGSGIGAEKEDPFSERVILSPNWIEGFHRMLYYNAGVFYENQLVKFFYKIDILDDSKLLYKFQVINKSFKLDGNELTSFKILSLKNRSTKVHPSYLVKLLEHPDQIVKEKSKFEVEVRIRDIIDIETAPILSLSFTCGGSFTQLNLKLGITSLKTLTPTELSMEDFKNRWLQINQLLPNNKGEFVTHSRPKHNHTALNIVRLLTRMNFAVIFNSQDSENILVLAAGILHTQTNNYGVLVSIKSMEIEVLDNIGTRSKDFEITVKCTGEDIAKNIATTLHEILQGP